MFQFWKIRSSQSGSSNDRIVRLLCATIDKLPAFLVLLPSNNVAFQMPHHLRNIPNEQAGICGKL